MKSRFYRFYGHKIFSVFISYICQNRTSILQKKNKNNEMNGWEDFCVRMWWNPVSKLFIYNLSHLLRILNI